jgi:hypothetical protein
MRVLWGQAVSKRIARGSFEIPRARFFRSRHVAVGGYYYELQINDSELFPSVNYSNSSHLTLVLLDNDAQSRLSVALAKTLRIADLAIDSHRFERTS